MAFRSVEKDASVNQSLHFTCARRPGENRRGNTKRLNWRNYHHDDTCTHWPVGLLISQVGRMCFFFCAAQVRKWRLCRRRGEYGDGVWWPLHLLFLINSNQSTVLAFSRLWNTWHVYKLETCRPTFFFFLNSFFNFRVNVTRWMMKTIESAADRLFIDCVHCRHL